MDSREDDDIPFDSDEDEAIIRELRIEIIRLEAQLDQLIAADRERAEEIGLLQARLTHLEIEVARLRERYRKSSRLWGWIAGFYGVSIGMWVNWLIRLWW
ncbi:MAG: hypothetical protein C0467_02080 [Planctomycetaceae bacterium]|nr:hypothetical protein [Planctomycetaceae bacterium]